MWALLLLSQPRGAANTFPCGAAAVPSAWGWAEHRLHQPAPGCSPGRPITHLFKATPTTLPDLCAGVAALLRYKHPQQLLWPLASMPFLGGVEADTQTTKNWPLKTLQLDRMSHLRSELFTAAQLLFQSHSEHSPSQILFNKSLLLSFPLPTI